MSYDIIIVGSGLAGLYSAYNILKMDPGCKILILEQYNRKWLGGRSSNETFYDTTIVTGAGIGRRDKDYLLLDLLKELKIPSKPCPVYKNYSSAIKEPVDILAVMRLLRKEYKKCKVPPKCTFKEFAKKVLGSKMYDAFTTSAGYTDYENEDVYETLFEYGFEDNGEWMGFTLNWKRLVETLYEKIGPTNFLFEEKVVSLVNQRDGLFQIVTGKCDKFISQKVIIATTITGVMNLVPGAKKRDSIYRQIHGQPFLRMYGKFNKKSADIMREKVPCQTIVPGPMHKMIPMSFEKGVYMIAYADNEGATFFKDHLENTPENRAYWCECTEKALDIPSGTLVLQGIKDFYWPIGTHYYGVLKGYKSRAEFIKKAQHPMAGLLVVGELISENQGWTEGALESVKAVLTKKWVLSRRSL